jgi:hypothetical protein
MTKGRNFLFLRLHYALVFTSRTKNVCKRVANYKRGPRQRPRDTWTGEPLSSIRG